MQTTLGTLADILHIATDAPDTIINGLSIDTRTIQPGNLFIAIAGKNFDGQTFIAEAQQKGAAAALVTHTVAANLPQLATPDTIAALGKIATHWRQQFTLPLIAVTGSCGKTTMKNMLTAIFTAACDHQAAEVFATLGNLNNHIGLPLTLSRLQAQHRYGVVEMGMNHAGEIAYLSQLAQPTVAVITNAAPVHLEGLKTIEAIAQAKGEIFLGLAKNGLGILNYDDPYFDLWQNLLGQRDFLTFGVDYVADFTATIADTVNNTTQNFALQTPAGEIAIRLPLPGRHNIMNALAASAAAFAADIELPIIKKGLENVTTIPGRLHITELAAGIRLIDDTYNANPSSVQAAAETLALQPGKKIFVLSDMRELGAEAESLHFTAGQNIQAANIDYLFTYGDLSQAAAKGFGPRAQHFSDQDSLVQALQSYLKPSVTILVKGSRSMRMENVVTKLKAAMIA